MDSNLALRSVEDNDLEQLKDWLNKDHVLRWYHDADEWLNEIKERTGKFYFLNHFIVLNDEKPIGFCQYYDCFEAKENWYSVSYPKEMFSIDYFIGEEEYLQKGLGKEIIKTLVGTIRGQYPNTKVVVQPEKENVASCKALLSNSFIYDKDRDYYVLK